MPKFIPTGWFPAIGSLYQIPLDIVNTHSGILFYSEYNTPEQIKKLKDFSKNLKSSLVIRLEDIPETGENNIGPTYEKMEMIKSFIENHRTDDLIVSCHGGISRTGAIVDYIMQIHHYQLDLDNVKYANVSYSPNHLMTMYLQQLTHEYTPSKTLDYYPDEHIWRINDDETFIKKNHLENLYKK